MRTTTAICRNPTCGKAFEARADALYCSGACRVAAHRKRATPTRPTWWLAKAPKLSTVAKGDELSNEELGDRLVDISETGDDGNPKTGRRFWYLALSHGYVNPDMGDSAEAKKSRSAAQKRIERILGVLRKQGRIGWDAVLDLTRDLDEWQTYRSPRDARAALRRRYDEDRWLGQEYFPVLVVEKDTLEPVCRPMAMDWQMPFASSRGYSSLTLQHGVAKMLRERRANSGQRGVVFFVSDLDPSGLDLQRAWEEAFQDFGAPVAKFVRLGLTRAQVADPDLIEERLREGIGVKPSNSRSADYVNRYGDRCWEADILPASAIQAAIDDHIDTWIDVDAWNRRSAEIERARELI